MESERDLRLRLKDLDNGVQNPAHLSNRQWFFLAGHHLLLASVPPQIRHHPVLVDEVEANAVLDHVGTGRGLLQFVQTVLCRFHGTQSHRVSQGLIAIPPSARFDDRPVVLEAGSLPLVEETVQTEIPEAAHGWSPRA